MSVMGSNNILSKEDICKFVSVDTSLSNEVCSVVIDSFLINVAKSVKSGKRIKLREFGSFLNKTKIRKGKEINTILFVSSCVLGRG